MTKELIDAFNDAAVDVQMGQVEAMQVYYAPRYDDEDPRYIEAQRKVREARVRLNRAAIGMARDAARRERERAAKIAEDMGRADVAAAIRG